MNSRIILAKGIKIDRNYTNVLSYSEADMLLLLRSQDHLVNEASDYSFVRTNNNIWTGFTYNECLEANYIAFQNPNYSNKWFFAWIDDVIYKGDMNTEISFTVDSWSTWWDRWSTKPCFVVREHVNDDTVGLHIVNENLDIGEVIEESEIEDSSYSSEYGYWVAVASNWTIKDGSTGNELLEKDKGTQHEGITVYDNTIFGTKLFFFKIVDIEDFINLELFLFRTNLDGHIADVENIFIVPNLAINIPEVTQHTAYLIDTSKEFNFYTIEYDIEPKTFNTTINKLRSFSDYSPKNR